ncbi:MAG TPA: hypothetical protein VNP20_16550, partial [Nocardioidaceae bacterium]|nr:hypothetical protein [Nocardioidaceae bacterium]
MHKTLRSRVAAVSIGALTVVGLGAGGATAAAMIDSDDIRNNSIQQVDLGRDSVGASELKDNTVGPRYLTDGLAAQIAKGGKPGADGEDGADGVDGEDGIAGYEVRTYDYILGGAREGHDGVPSSYTGAGDGAIATVA